MAKHIPLIQQMEAYIKATGQTPTRFSLEAVRDGHFLARMRKSRTMERIDEALAYMADNPPKKGRQK